MLKYISKFAMDILPSLAATVLGAYIVNHYIVAKPGADVPAAAVSSASPKKADPKLDQKPSQSAAVPQTGVSDKNAENNVTDKPLIEKSSVETPALKSVDKPSETASFVVDTRRHPVPRDKTAAKTVAAPLSPATAVVATPNSAPAVEAAIGPDDHRDANDLARAAIERLRGSGESSPRAAETARIPDVPHVVAAAPAASVPPVAASPVRPLPPPIVVATPASEPPGSAQGLPPYYPATAGFDPNRPTPPADIPSPPPLPPLDLRAETTGAVMREHTNVAEDMFAAAKSVFHAVLPH
jgi:hypothetical protein